VNPPDALADLANERFVEEVLELVVGHARPCSTRFGIPLPACTLPPA
jgi:hypothetical protein